jgi:hypothetical protein
MNGSSKFGLIKETMDPSRILLAVLCLEGSGIFINFNLFIFQSIQENRIYY